MISDHTYCESCWKPRFLRLIIVDGAEFHVCSLCELLGPREEDDGESPNVIEEFYETTYGPYSQN